MSTRRALADAVGSRGKGDFARAVYNVKSTSAHPRFGGRMLYITMANARHADASAAQAWTVTGEVIRTA